VKLRIQKTEDRFQRTPAPPAGAVQTVLVADKLQNTDRRRAQHEKWAT
jgi:hypothetical protein